MIRFVDLRNSDAGYRFAFFDTVTDKFVEFAGTHAWDTWKEFATDYNGNELNRFRKLCPEWANADEPSTGERTESEHG